MAVTESGPDTGNAGASTTEKDPLSAAISSAIESTTAPDEKSDEKPSTQPVGDDAGTQQAEQAQTGSETTPKDETATEAPKGQSDAIEAPQHWPADRREAFAKLPEDARKLTFGFVKDLTAGFTRKMQEVGDKVRLADQMGEVFTDHDVRQLQQSGMSVPQCIAGWKQMAAFYAQDPVGYIRYVAQQSKLDPSQIFPQQQAPDPQQELDALLIDPNVKTLQDRLEKFERMIADGQRQQHEASRAQVQQHVSTLTNAVSSFRSALDDAGQLRYPHFDNVQRAMGALMETHPRLASMPDSYEKMDLAYQMAIKADPELGQSVIESEVARRVAQEKAAFEAQRAKAAGGIRPATGASAVRPKALTLDDAISGAMSQAGV